MAVSADSRFSLSAADQLLGSTGLGGRRYCSRLVKFGNGEVMGNKLKINQLRQGIRIPKQQVCMSLTAKVAGESKVSSSTHQAPSFFSKHTRQPCCQVDNT